MREIEQYSGRRVWIGPLYTSLAKLEAQGFVKARLGEPLAVRGGRARRHVTLTPAGLRALTDSLARLDRMREGLRLFPTAGVRR
jgi:DNA-binding PadR family transcriptional regulator